jgi:hypothetical protein
VISLPSNAYAAQFLTSPVQEISLCEICFVTAQNRNDPDDSVGIGDQACGLVLRSPQLSTEAAPTAPSHDVSQWLPA